MGVLQLIKMIAALLLGAGIGALYFGGLWWTVQRVASVRHPALLTLGSFFGRTILAVGVFYLILCYGHWGLLLAALAGFIVARIVMVRRIQRPMKTVLRTDT